MKRRDALQLLPAAAGGLALAGTSSAGPAVPLRADLSWWREARLGMFVHWGPVSQSLDECVRTLVTCAGGDGNPCS